MKKLVGTWKLYLPELYQTLGIMLFGGIFGIILVKIIVSIDPSDGYTVLGSLIALFIGMGVTVMLSIFSFGVKFNMAVTMGYTRKEFFIAYWTGECAFVAAEIAAVLLFGLLETKLGSIMYPDSFLSEELNLLPLLSTPKVIVSLLLLVPAFGMFVGVLMMKFQMKAFWGLWAAWMVVTMGSAKLKDVIEQNPDGMAAQILSGVIGIFQTISGFGLIALFLIISILFLVFSAVFLRKQEVM